VRLNRIGANLPCNLYVKLEYFNPGLSIKDRIGWVMIEEAERRGDLEPGGTVIESTSGNTGIGLALAATIKGYRVVFVMPDKVSSEKVANLRAFGAKVITCPTAVEPEDPRSYYSVSRRTGGEVDTIVLGIGTGGTVSGIGKYLKEQKPTIKMVGVDPVGSIYHSMFHSGEAGSADTYLIEGIGEDFMPSSIEDLKWLDDVVQVEDGEAYFWTRELIRLEGVFVGSSGGAALAGALKYGRCARAGENVIIILPDSGVKYLSKAFNDDWLRENGLLEARLQGTVRDVLDRKGGDIITVDHQSPVQDAVHKMQELGISQIPVVDGDEPVGVVTESDLLNGLCSSSISPVDPVDKILSARFAQLPADAPLETLVDTLERAPLVIIRDDSGVAGVITKIDLLTHLTERYER